MLDQPGSASRQHSGDRTRRQRDVDDSNQHQIDGGRSADEKSRERGLQRERERNRDENPRSLQRASPLDGARPSTPPGATPGLSRGRGDPEPVERSSAAATSSTPGITEGEFSTTSTASSAAKSTAGFTRIRSSPACGCTDCISPTTKPLG